MSNETSQGQTFSGGSFVTDCYVATGDPVAGPAATGPHANSDTNGQASMSLVQDIEIPAREPFLTPDSAAQANDPAAPKSTPNAAASTQRIINFHDLPPDGQESSLRRCLNLLAQLTGARIALAFHERLANSTIVCSDHFDIASLSYERLLKSALLEATTADKTIYFASKDNRNSALLEQVREAHQALLELSIGVNLGDAKVGLVLEFSQPPKASLHGDFRATLAKFQSDFNPWLHQWLISRDGVRYQRLRQRIVALSPFRQRIALLVIAVVLSALTVPLPYWPQRECVVEPSIRTYLASPIVGRLIETNVRPGDVVSAGQLLARLDDEQIRWELSSAEAEYESAGKRRDSALATKSGGDLRLAQLERERIAVQIESLKKQLEQLEIRSPADGVVVQGDWFRSQGAPVERGQTLFEIAPLDTMQVNIHLKTEDLPNIEVGMIATVRVDAAYGQSWENAISRIDPRGQVKDSQVVFNAEIEVTNADHQLRPGMKGTVRITAGTRSLGWLLFHKPYVWMMKKLAW